MSDRFIIEISTTQTVAGVIHTERVGDLILTTTDPVAAVEFRKSLRSMMAGTGYDLKLVSEETERRTVITAFNEDHFRTKAQPEDGRFIALQNDIGGLLKAETLLAGEGRLSTNDLQNVVTSMRRMMLDDETILAPLVRAQTSVDLTMGERVAALTVVMAACRDLAMSDKRRWEIGQNLSQTTPNSLVKPNKRLCEAHALQDRNALLGKTIPVHEVDGYVGDTSDQASRTAPDNDPFMVTVTAIDGDSLFRWMDDENLDPVYSVVPGPNENRLGNLRSIWVQGRSFSIAREG